MGKSTILITGGAGFIGSTANLMLREAGFETVVLDNLVTGSKDTLIQGKFVFGDFGDSPLLDQIFSTHKIDGVVHFAAYTDVGQSVKDPVSYYRNNVLNTLVLLEAMKKASIQHLIFSSTAAVYGIPARDELFETDPCQPINPYGESKWMIEKILKDYHAAWGLKSCSLRYFNAAGGDPQGRLKYAYKKGGNLIPIILNSILKQEPITVFGTDYSTKDGTCIRDYVHVADLGTAHILALKKLFSGNTSFCYNLGNKQGYSVLDVISASEEVTGKKVHVIKGPRRPGDPPKLIANAEKAHHELAWKPKYPTIKEMIEHAWIAARK